MRECIGNKRKISNTTLNLKKESNKEEEKFYQLPNLMNDGSNEPQEQDNYSTSSSERRKLILSICGGAYPKSGMNQRGAYEGKY